jgi:uncharacterized membrane protein YsdA (DUF1294 family)
VRLVSARYVFTVLANLLVFLLYLRDRTDSAQKYRTITYETLAVR